MGTKKGQVRKTARRAYEPKKKKKKKDRLDLRKYDDLLLDSFFRTGMFRGKK